MTIRFFILQAHYRGTVDFSNDALKAAEKAYDRIVDGYRRLQELKPADSSSVDVKGFRKNATMPSTMTSTRLSLSPSFSMPAR